MFGIRRNVQVRLPFAAPCREQLRARPMVWILEDRSLPSFLAPINYPTGVGPYGMALGDLNGDGVPDLVVANNGYFDGSFSSVSILLGKGGGSFQPARNLDVGRNPFGVAVGDFNGDGIPDLAVTHAFSDSDLGTVSVLLGNGDGSFQAPVDYQVGAEPKSIAVGDFTGDGTLDLVTANYRSGTLSVLLGNGDGTFQNAVSVPIGHLVNSVTVADFRGNGTLDIVTADVGDAHGDGGGVSVLLGNGDGTFQDALTYGLGQAGSRPNANAVAVGDFNGDGVPDLATANVSDDGTTVGVLLGNGNGTFQDAVTYPVSPVFLSIPGSIAVGDFNGDGQPDVIISHVVFQDTIGGLDQLFLLAGNGDGSFQAPVAFDSGHLAHALVVGDFNNDGALDVAATNISGNDVSVLLGRGDGSFNHAPDFASGTGAFAIAWGDFNRDGIPDLVTANKHGQSVSVLLGTGDGTFQAPVNYAVGRLPESVVVGDFNGDGIPDLIVGDPVDDTLTLLVGNGDGTFQPGRIVAQGVDALRVAAARLTGAGPLDLLVTEGLSNPTLQVFLGNGDGTFRPLPRKLIGGANPYGLAVADLNNDGKLDAVVSLDGLQGGVLVLPGNGDGTFGTGQFYPTGSAPTGVAVTDFTGDGVPDLAVANYLGGTVSVLRGNGDGTFQPAVNYVVGGNPISVVAADFNGDGILDLAVANQGDNSVSVLLGNGDGSFQPEVRYLVGSQPSALVAADFNGDGAPDLATANFSSTNVTVLLNQNDGARPGRGAPARPPVFRSRLPQPENALVAAAGLMAPAVSLEVPALPPRGRDLPLPDAFLAAPAAEVPAVIDGALASDSYPLTFHHQGIHDDPSRNLDQAFMFDFNVESMRLQG